ncbi:MAG: hypothetical protein KDK41_00900 [Leptospiraceae bacterium]|nr:hypothetical protein [Leptospiraceae bacterium]
MSATLTAEQSIPTQKLKSFTDLKKARAETQPLNALSSIKKIAPRVRDEFMASGKVLAVRQFSCSVSPYPTVYGFHTTYGGLHPYLYFNNRATLVQFLENGEVKNFLFNPIFPEYSEKAPFYVTLRANIPSFIPEAVFVKRERSIINQLADVGIRSDDIDYISYDHLHVQDLRPLMGLQNGQAALFPNAKFVFPRKEWESVVNLHPSVSEWYVPQGIAGVREENLVLYDDDLFFGPGLALILTPGHTAGNHSLYVHSDAGTMTISENGVGPDAYNPENSKINSVRQAAKDRGWEVVLNANTLDYRLDQYNSMVLEKLLSGPAKNPDFCNHHSSSEFTTWISAPGLSPSYEHGSVNCGSLKLR